MRFVERMLSGYKEITMSTLLAHLPDREPRRYLYDLLPQYPQRSGKGLRPALCLATCGAFGGRVENAVPSAVSIELFHNAFLVHDDVEDGSNNRRGLPTLNSKHGTAIAVNVGDALNVMSIRPLMLNSDLLGPVLTWQIFTEIEHMVRTSVEGQAMELGWIRDNCCTLTEADYMEMILKKTCWYTCIHPCRIGGLIGTQGMINPDRFNRFGYYIGAAFQIQDDLLNLIGDEARYGKEIGGDIYEGKRTLMLIHLLNQCTRYEKEKIRNFLRKSRSRRTSGEVAWVYGMMDKYGSIPYAQSCARQLTGAAYREFSIAFQDLPESRHREFIQNLVFYMIDRDL